MLKLGQLRVGKVDGKHEYLTPKSERDQHFFDAFLIPDTVDVSRLRNDDTFFIEGFRGTGKTSLIRWHAESKRKAGNSTQIVLFKSELTESQRIHLSNEVGISWSDVDSNKMEIAQDFKSSWRWFIHHKIGEIFSDLFGADPAPIIKRYKKLLGLDEPGVFQKAIGFMPKLEGASVKIKANLEFFEAELGGDFRKEGTQAKVTLDAINSRLDNILSGIELSTNIYIYFDELEVFLHTEEQYHRDQRMVRDLLFSISHFNRLFSSNSLPIHVIGAVRSEVLDAMGALGQEVDRVVHDQGFVISWHHANKSLDHPLISMIARKISASERDHAVSVSNDPIETYFPKNINGETIASFILDRSFYKPRDIVWRLSIAQKLFPQEQGFSDRVLLETETEYSSKLWDEVRYELSATYSESDVNVIEAVFSGSNGAFTLIEITARFERLAQTSPNAQKLLARRSVEEILRDLYRLGAIGNAFRAGTTGTDIKNRWAFRGDPTLLIEKRMVIHNALAKRLSVVKARRRGSRPTDRKRRGETT